MLGRYKTLTKETVAVLKGEYGATPAPVNPELQARVLKGGRPLTSRPADVLPPEFDRLRDELHARAAEKGMTLAGDGTDDVLTYALFGPTALRFLENRGNPAAFEPAPEGEPDPVRADT
jgi:oxaloacetate decarboxylase alpha subunit